MIRILVIGNSHVAAPKKAEPAFNEIYANIELSFFAVSEPYFSKGRTNEKSIYSPHENANLHEKIILGDGQAKINFAEYDHVLAVGLRAPQTMLSAVMEGYDILEGEHDGKGGLVSQNYLRDLSHAQAQLTVSKWEATLGKNFVGAICPAPFPSVAINKTTRRVDRRARASRTLHQHAAAEWLFELWRSDLESRMSDNPATLLWQPKQTIHAPFVAKEEYAEPDNVHMNARFGLLMLSNYIDTMRILPSTSN